MGRWGVGGGWGGLNMPEELFMLVRHNDQVRPTS